MLLWLTHTRIHVKIVVALLFASYILVLLESTHNVFNIIWRHKSITEPCIKGELRCFDLNALVAHVCGCIRLQLRSGELAGAQRDLPRQHSRPGSLDCNNFQLGVKLDCFCVLSKFAWSNRQRRCLLLVRYVWARCLCVCVHIPARNKRGYARTDSTHLQPTQYQEAMEGCHICAVSAPVGKISLLKV